MLKAKEARTPNSLQFWPLIGLCKWSEMNSLCKWIWMPWSGRARLCAKGAIADPSSVATGWQASQKEHSPWAALTFKLFEAVQGRPWTQSTASELGVEYLQRLRRVLIGNTMRRVGKLRMWVSCKLRINAYCWWLLHYSEGGPHCVDPSEHNSLARQQLKRSELEELKEVSTSESQFPTFLSMSPESMRSQQVVIIWCHLYLLHYM